MDNKRKRVIAKKFMGYRIQHNSEVGANPIPIYTPEYLHFVPANVGENVLLNTFAFSAKSCPKKFHE